MQKCRYCLLKDAQQTFQVSEFLLHEVIFKVSLVRPFQGKDTEHGAANVGDQGSGVEVTPVRSIGLHRGGTITELHTTAGRPHFCSCGREGQ